jgi:hypothetical protein
VANEYVTLVQLKAALRITDSADDTELDLKRTAASRRVERDTGRRFWVDGSASARTYKATHPTLLMVDDISTTSGLVVEVGRGTSWTTVASTGYDYLPENAIADGKPIEIIERVDGVWPLWGSTRVRVTATWGWAAVPEDIKNATIIMAARLFRRKDSPEGVKGFADLGVVRLSRYDSDYDDYINPYKRDKP